MITRLLKKWYGDFTREELHRTILLGVAFALIIGTYWTMRPLKDALFDALVIGEGEQANTSLLAWAKIISLGTLIPVTLVYSRLVDFFKRNRLFYLLGGLAAGSLIVFALLFADATFGLPNKEASPYRVLGWAWYTFVEVYGSLLVALFWAYCSDLIDAETAKRSFPLIVLFGQVGGIVGPQSTDLPALLGFQTSAPLVAACGVSTLAFVLVIRCCAARMARDKSLYAALQPAEPKSQAESHTGFLEGLRLLATDRYLLGIFAVVAVYEVVVTIFDFNFKRLAFASTTGDQATASLLGDYGSMVNIVSFLCLACGISNVQRRLGMRAALCSMPFVIGAMVLAFDLAPTLRVLFWIMVAGKAINYALNSPSLKQLYIPTSLDAKYKSQAWIEMFGARGAKAGGSGFNTLLKVFQSNAASPAAGFAMYVLVASAFSGVLLVGWFFVAWFLAREYDRRVVGSSG
jgi:AAA family ATP:ADP antiporter